MTSLTIEQIEQILADAPEGATHYAQGMHYLSLNKNNNWTRHDPNGLASAKWFSADEFKFSYVNKNFHSLSDLETILSQHKEIEQLKARVFDSITPTEDK